MPKSWPLKGASVLIASVSARALAAAARRAGLIPLTVDFFADLDTAALAFAALKLGTPLRAGLQRKPLFAALRALANQAPSPVIGLLYGSGFDGHPELLAALGKNWPLLGCEAATVAALKDPRRFFSALDQLDIACPATQFAPPDALSGWLLKRVGGAGGSHVRLASQMNPADQVSSAGSGRSSAQDYYQRQIAGESVSMLFVANGRAARALGFSGQWTAPKPGHPFRYGGAAQPAAIAPELHDRMVQAVERLASAFAIKGLASADFIVADGTAFLLEINPRPGATLDIFDQASAPLLQFHLDAVLEGSLPTAPDRNDGTAQAIVYAPEPIMIGKDLRWPDWVCDRPKPGEHIARHDPICTVQAHATTMTQAKRLAQRRISAILAAVGALRRTTGDNEIAGAERQQECAAHHRNHDP